jgi:hypothetical protein
MSSSTELRHARGSVFVDYVRMIKTNKTAEWGKHLTAADLLYLRQPIAPDDWYPMGTFERMGLAILAEIAGGRFELVRMWGRFQTEALLHLNPTMVARGDPRDSLMRFQVVRRAFFDFEALTVRSVEDDHALIAISYHMSPIAEEAACWQTMGFLEQLVGIAGGTEVVACFRDKAWEGAPSTIVELSWKL